MEPYGFILQMFSLLPQLVIVSSLSTWKDQRFIKFTLDVAAFNIIVDD